MTTRTKLFGDTEKADQFRFIAFRKVLGDALRLRSFQNLAVFKHQQKIEGGGFIEVICHHGDNEINIYVPPSVPEPSEKPEPRPHIACIVSIGDDKRGYHFFLWDQIKGARITGNSQAKTLDDIYAKFYPIIQDSVFHPVAAWGGSKWFNFWPMFDNGIDRLTRNFDVLNCDPPDFQDGPNEYYDVSDECTNSKTNNYNHPEGGDITDTYTLHKFFKEVPNDSLDWWTIRDTACSLPYAGTISEEVFSSYELKPIPIEAQLTKKDICDIDIFYCKVPYEDHFLEKQLGVADLSSHDTITAWYIPTLSLYEHKNYEFNVPTGKMRRTKGTSYADLIDIEDDKQLDHTKLRFGILPRFKEDSVLYDKSFRNAAGTTVRYPYRQGSKFDSETGFYVALDTDLKHSKEIETKQCDYGFCLIFATSWVEVQGYTDTPDDKSSWAYSGKQDMTYISAATGLEKPDSGLESHKGFEQAITDLIDWTNKDQRDKGFIDDEQTYKGQLSAYFTDLGHTEDELLERHKMMEFLRILNETRKDRGLEILRWNFDLEHAARRHCIDLAVNKPVAVAEAHDGSDGSTGVERVYNANFWDNQYFQTAEEDSWSMGENILWLTMGYEPNTGQRAFDRWKASPPHWSNMIYEGYRETALDIRYKEADDGYTYAVWVQVFGYNWYNEQ